jgi:hypothetical protein
MAKKSTSGKNPFSQDTRNGEEGSDTLSLYGQVNALTAQDNSVQLSPMAASKPSASADQTQSASSGTSPALTADASIMQAAASFSVNKVYQHWADGDAMQGTSAE